MDEIYIFVDDVQQIHLTAMHGGGGIVVWACLCSQDMTTLRSFTMKNDKI